MAGRMTVNFLESLGPKAFFECYRNAAGERVIQARVVSSSMAYAKQIRALDWPKPTSEYKKGSLAEFVWIGPDAWELAKALGQKGVWKHDGAVGC